MSGDNQCYCQNCKDLRDAKVTKKIFCTPPYLIINIDYGKNNKYKPLKVDYGELIDLTNFTDEKCKERLYELKAVISLIKESGNKSKYITYCKDNLNLWHVFNDSLLSDCEFKDVTNNSPQLLIYKKEKYENLFN